jgi:hypothetical protein
MFNQNQNNTQAGHRIVKLMQKKSSHPPTPWSSLRIGPAEAGSSAVAGAAAGAGGSRMLASCPQSGQISEASAICSPHRAQNMVHSPCRASSRSVKQNRPELYR